MREDWRRGDLCTERRRERGVSRAVERREFRKNREKVDLMSPGVHDEM